MDIDQLMNLREAVKTGFLCMEDISELVVLIDAEISRINNKSRGLIIARKLKKIFEFIFYLFLFFAICASFVATMVLMRGIIG